LTGRTVFLLSQNKHRAVCGESLKFTQGLMILFASSERDVTAGFASSDCRIISQRESARRRREFLKIDAVLALQNEASLIFVAHRMMRFAPR
jgi:hypothetical protein